MPSVLHASGASFRLASVRAPHGSFIVVLRPLPRFTLSACLAVLTLSVYHTFSGLSRVFRLSRFVSESKLRQPLDVLDYSTFPVVCQELFSWSENFALSDRSSLLRRRRYALHSTAVSGRSVPQSVTNSILTAFRPCYAVSGVYVQSMTSGVPLSRRRFIDCLHDTTLCAFCQARFFTFSAVIYLQSCFLLRFRYLSFLLIADFHYILRIFQTILIFRPE